MLSDCPSVVFDDVNDEFGRFAAVGSGRKNWNYGIEAEVRLAAAFFVSLHQCMTARTRERKDHTGAANFRALLMVLFAAGPNCKRLRLSTMKLQPFKGVLGGMSIWCAKILRAWRILYEFPYRFSFK